MPLPWHEHLLDAQNHVDMHIDAHVCTRAEMTVSSDAVGRLDITPNGTESCPEVPLDLKFLLQHTVGFVDLFPCLSCTTLHLNQSTIMC